MQNAKRSLSFRVRKTSRLSLSALSLSVPLPGVAFPDCYSNTFHSPPILRSRVSEMTWCPPATISRALFRI